MGKSVGALYFCKQLAVKGKILEILTVVSKGGGDPQNYFAPLEIGFIRCEGFLSTT